MATSREPVFPGGALAEGAHINAVGTFSHEGCEIEGEVVLRSRLVVDSREAALREAGDVRIRIAEGLFGPDHIDAELGEIVNGAKPRGRMGHEFTLFKSVGNAAQDVAVAASSSFSWHLGPAPQRLRRRSGMKTVLGSPFRFLKDTWRRSRAFLQSGKVHDSEASV